MTTFTDTTMTIDEQVRYLMQGTEYGDRALADTMGKELRERLLAAKKEGRPLRVYCGFDPRTSNLHIGHTVPIRKLRQFQELGHEVTFLIGTFTSTIGDPSDKDLLRTILTRDEAMSNAKTYAEQAFKILDPETTAVRYNDEWLSGLSFQQVIELASSFTLQQFLTRENFRKRWDKNEPVYLHETFYALMQGYDACALEADVQVGGTDQLFNIVTAARKIMNARGLPPNVAVIMGILPGTDGVIKMSKSLGNHIPIMADPKDMYGKVMSIPDTALADYFEMVTPLKPDDIEKLLRAVNRGELHPMNAKMRLAREIVGVFHSSVLAAEAEQRFQQVFQNREDPEDMPGYVLDEPITLVDLLRKANLAESNSEARRLISQGAVRIDGEGLTDHTKQMREPGVLQVGKRKFLRLQRGEQR